jgi:vesicular inhibitory amino acid transporter
LQYILDFLIAIAGLLMFGDRVMNEVTGNILASSGYPRTLSIFTCIFIAIIPLTKVPLNGRPIVSTIETLTGLGPETVSETPALTGMSGYTRGILRFLIRVFVIILFVVVAILFPAFDSIMAFMGSALCFTICVILPLLFYLKIFGKEVSPKERVLAYFLITASSILALIGTVFAFLPKSMIGAE